MFPFPVTYAPSTAHLAIMFFLQKNKQKLIEIVAKPGGLDGSSLVNVSLNLGAIHVWGVLEILREAGELEDDGVKDVLEHHVEVLILG